MADVLIVCVREDEPQAKALADMFEAAGFSIGGAPSSDAALRSSGAGVVVWSQASIRSRPFLDAAQRVINADKAIVASLIEPPPPSSIGSSLAFDLSRWDGDPNDPALDPLFFAVDRMVNAARASVGAPAGERPDPAYERPSARAQRPVAAAPAQRPAARPEVGAEKLDAEAEHWRAIRDSRDPADFMDYLARYGAAGTFSEVAELRLKQLTAGGAPTSRTVTPPPARRAEAPPPRRVEPAPPPPRRADPPPRRAEAPLPPTRRAAPPPRRLDSDRGFDRADLREPQREGGGGALRTFILIALLGGAALVGGLYFGGSMSDSGAVQQEDLTAPDTGASPPPGFGEDTAALDEPATLPADTQSDAAARAAEQRERARERERERQRERELAAAEPTPAPTMSIASSSGPVPLTPGELANNGSTPASGQSVVVPIQPSQLPPPPAPATTTSATARDPAPIRGTTGSVVFTQRPSARRIADLYPSNALRDGIGGRVELSCRVQSNLTLACSVASETPRGQGFGDAAVRASSSYRARATLSDGASAIGTTTRIAVSFQAPQ